MAAGPSPQHDVADGDDEPTGRERDDLVPVPADLELVNFGPVAGLTSAPGTDLGPPSRLCLDLSETRRSSSYRRARSSACARAGQACPQGAILVREAAPSAKPSARTPNVESPLVRGNHRDGLADRLKGRSGSGKRSRASTRVSTNIGAWWRCVRVAARPWRNPELPLKPS